MKKIIVLFSCLLLMCGCTKSSEDKLIKDFEHNINSSKSYTLSGSLEIYSEEDTFNYLVEVAYKKKDMYKVKLTNTLSNNEQVILKNNEGVYVITPSLNKSFKFQSEWPNNSSQVYILSSIYNDLKNTENKNYTIDNDNYILTSDVEYPNNPNLTYQKLYFDKDSNLIKVEVFDSDNALKIRFIVAKIDYKANLDDNYFSIENNIDESKKKEDGVSNILDEIIYPLYIPSETYLTSKETISTDTGNRAILTFSGKKDFVLIEEVSSAASEFETIPVYGDPIMMNGNVGALSGNSLTWTSNNIDYYLAGSDLSKEELLSVANSISNTISTVTEK